MWPARAMVTARATAGARVTATAGGSVTAGVMAMATAPATATVRAIIRTAGAADTAQIWKASKACAFRAGLFSLYSMIRKGGHRFSARSCSTNDLERNADST